MNQDTLLKLPQVKKITALSRSEIYKRMKAGNFPKQIKLSVKNVAWPESEVYQWVNSQISHSRQTQQPNA